MMRGLWRSFVPFLLWWPEVDRGTLKADGARRAHRRHRGAAPGRGLRDHRRDAAGVRAVRRDGARRRRGVVRLVAASSSRVPPPPRRIVLFSTLSALAVPGTEAYVRYALTLTFMVGAVQLVMGLARLGTLVNFVSHSVIVGFTSGAAVLIAASQLKNFLGLEMPGGLRLHEILTHLWRLLGDIDPDSVTVGVVTLAVGIAIRRYWPRFPYMVAALLAGSLLAGLIEFFTYAGFPALRQRRERPPARGRGARDVASALGSRLQPRRIHPTRPRRARGDPVRADRGGVHLAIPRGALRRARGRQPGVRRAGGCRTSSGASSRPTSRPGRSIAAR